MTIAQKLNRARILHGLSIYELSEATGLSEEQLRSYESGKSVPMKSKILLSEILHVSLFYLRNRKCDDPHAMMEFQEDMKRIYREQGEKGLKAFEAKFPVAKKSEVDLTYFDPRFKQTLF